MKKLIYIVLISFMLQSCDQDDYNKNEFRCVINGERLSTPLHKGPHPRRFDSAPHASWTDSTKTGVTISAELSGSTAHYFLDLQVDSINGTGLYFAPKFSATLNGSNVMQQFSFESMVDTTYDALINITYFNKSNGIAGYFYFMALDTLTGSRLPVTNGRFNVEWAP